MNTFDRVFDYITNTPLNYWDRKEELRWLYDIGIRWSYAHQGGHFSILEIGTYTGATAVCIASGINTEICKYKMTTIDKCLFETPQKVADNIKKANTELGLNISFIESDDLDYLKSVAGKSVDILYIDTLHTKEHMDRILPVCLPKMANGGLLFGHDYTPEFAGVVESVTNFKQNNHQYVIGSGQDYSIWWVLIR